MPRAPHRRGAGGAGGAPAALGALALGALALGALVPSACACLPEPSLIGAPCLSDDDCGNFRCDSLDDGRRVCAVTFIGPGPGPAEGEGEGEGEVAEGEGEGDGALPQCVPFLDVFDLCDCGCGVADGDCFGDGCADPGCAGLGCERCWDGFGNVFACGDGGTCPQFIGQQDGCDCGCGVFDPDCGGGGCAEPSCFAFGCQFCFDAFGNSITCGGEGEGEGEGEACVDIELAIDTEVTSMAMAADPFNELALVAWTRALGADSIIQTATVSLQGFINEIFTVMVVGGGAVVADASFNPESGFFAVLTLANAPNNAPTFHAFPSTALFQTSSVNIVLGVNPPPTVAHAALAPAPFGDQVIVLQTANATINGRTDPVLQGRVDFFGGLIMPFVDVAPAPQTAVRWDGGGVAVDSFDESVRFVVRDAASTPPSASADVLRIDLDGNATRTPARNEQGTDDLVLTDDFIIGGRLLLWQTPAGALRGCSSFDGQLCEPVPVMDPFLVDVERQRPQAARLSDGRVAAVYAPGPILQLGVGAAPIEPLFTSFIADAVTGAVDVAAVGNRLAVGFLNDFEGDGLQELRVVIQCFP